jgi:hypothetical protein
MVSHMMSLSEALTADRVEQYFSEHYVQDDYYTQGQTCIGQWIGKGAADLGLAGDVSREDFNALLQGISPHTGAVIIPPRPTTASTVPVGIASSRHRNQCRFRPSSAATPG